MKQVRQGHRQGPGGGGGGYNVKPPIILNGAAH